MRPRSHSNPTHEEAIAEIAILFQMKPNTVTVRYRRTLQRLRTGLPGPTGRVVGGD